jgi:3-hydroxyisobutyrate dehydrogenase-like beta-hydroxyacid dehydrogenase
MGLAMARNLLRSGHEVVAHNRHRDKAQVLCADGAQVADSPEQACRGAAAVMTMLSDDAAVEAVVFGEQGIAGALENDCVHVSHSTISTALARKLATEHARRGQRYLSVPVFGRPEAADAKKLLVVAGGAPDVIERCCPLFDAIGRIVFIAGTEPWQANAVKLSGNFMLASMMETFGEAFAMLRKSGVNPHIFLEIMNSLFASPVYANYGRIIADEQFEPAGFALKLGLKDARLALAAAEECSAPMPIASLIRDHFIAAIAQGQAEHDWSSITRVSARNAGL